MSFSNEGAAPSYAGTVHGASISNTACGYQSSDRSSENSGDVEVAHGIEPGSTAVKDVGVGGRWACRAPLRSPSRAPLEAGVRSKGGPSCKNSIAVHRPPARRAASGPVSAGLWCDTPPPPGARRTRWGRGSLESIREHRTYRGDAGQPAQ